MDVIIRSFVGVSLIGTLLWWWGGKHSLAWRKVFLLMGLHGAMALALFKMPAVTASLDWIGQGLNGLSLSVAQGTSFVFGYLGGGALPFDTTQASGTPFILMFQGLPAIVVTSALIMALFHIGLIPKIVQVLSRTLHAVTGMGGALSTGLVSKIFLGQTEIPLIIRPYVAMMSNHEVLVVMTAGMATSAWAIFVPYCQLLAGVLPSASVMSHLMRATLLNIVAAILAAEVLSPQQGQSTPGECQKPVQNDSLMQAISQGALDGWKVMMMIAAVMVAFVACADLANKGVAWLLSWTGQSITLVDVMSGILKPFMWLLGVSWQEAGVLAHWMGHKLLVNELVAFQQMAQSGVTENQTTRSLALYLLGSFGSIGSMGIQMACMGACDPKRSKWYGAWVVKALLGSIAANWYTSMIVRWMI
jgi:CNT family concentrative nucleoside transporter